MRIRLGGYTHDVRFEDLAAFLDRWIDGIKIEIPPSLMQFEFYFGGRFDWWWYDDAGRLHPNDDDFPEPQPIHVEQDDYDPFEDDDAWDDDIPF